MRKELMICGTVFLVITLILTTFVEAAELPEQPQPSVSGAPAESQPSLCIETTTARPTSTATPTPTATRLDDDEREPVLVDTLGGRQEMIARVTAYAPFDNQSGMCSDGDPNNTSTGQRPGPEIAAVDPDKIPYGTRFKLEGFGRIFVAGDTGSALRAYDGIAVDIFMETYEEAMRWGVQYLEIEVIDG